MGWGLRKSFGSKAFRVTVTHRGVGFSTGFKGFRVSINRRGSFVSLGTGGIYYRKRIGAPPAQRQKSQGTGQGAWFKTPQGQPAQGTPIHGAVSTANADQFIDQNSESILGAINETVATPGAMRVLLPIAIISTVGLSLFAPPMALIMPLLWAIPLVVVGHIDRVAQTYSLFYELDSAEEARWNDMCSRLAKLASANAIQRVAASVPTADYKSNAGANVLIARSSASLRQRAPQLIATNLKPWCLQLTDQALFFFPDRILVQQGRYFGAIEYDQLEISVAPEDFVEPEGVPTDAQIIGYTFQFVNKDGSPDRRYTVNHQIPIARYARVVLSTQSGLNIHLQVSSQLAASSILGWIRSKQSNSTNSSHFGRAGNGGTSHSGKTTNLPNCYTVLGVAAGCSKDDATSAYRNLVRKYHPDLVKHLGQELQDLAEHRMKEINQSWHEIRKINGW